MASRVDKWPNIISIGFGKCGTGSLAFIDCHSEIVFRAVEPGKNITGKFPVFRLQLSLVMFGRVPEAKLKLYNIPKATKSEVLVEKSPPYAQGDEEQFRV